ncbi:unnamed protein product [Prunus armeniaca]
MAIGERPPCMAIGAVFYGDLPLLLENCSGFNMGYWRLQNISFIHQLKDVTIELSIGSNGIRFAKYVLEHARNLKKMTFFSFTSTVESCKEDNKKHDCFQCQTCLFGGWRKRKIIIF